MCSILLAHPLSVKSPSRSVFCTCSPSGALWRLAATTRLLFFLAGHSLMIAQFGVLYYCYIVEYALALWAMFDSKDFSCVFFCRYLSCVALGSLCLLKALSRRAD
ncbi:hypothetical protein DM02DRAFT_16705 [Periconia macrospinosa]|uniref:Uncharacterized protein n=1 Tax=Periconia macrospinosa TaxID=97972 RepID=A0A2V1E713_9PLEO|nr:hypothetical protein DM02DRAFT_16705 [Periconia macrospinosa]